MGGWLALAAFSFLFGACASSGTTPSSDGTAAESADTFRCSTTGILELRIADLAASQATP